MHGYRKKPFYLVPIGTIIIIIIFIGLTVVVMDTVQRLHQQQLRLSKMFPFYSIVKHEWANLLQNKVTQCNPTGSHQQQFVFCTSMYTQISSNCWWLANGLYSLCTNAVSFYTALQKLNWMPEDGIRGLPIHWKTKQFRLNEACFVVKLLILFMMKAK